MEEDTATHEVWTATVDNSTWKVQVTAPNSNWYAGTLTVIRAKDGTVIHTEDVTVAYGAPFGPDVDDVHHWQQLSIEAIDNHIRGQ